MKVKVKRSDLFLMLNCVNSLAQIKGSCKFAYGIAKNKKILDDEVNAMREGIKPSQKYLEYENARIKLCEKYCDKDGGGNPIIVNNVYQGIGDNNQKFQEAIEKLNKENKKTLDERKKALEDFNEMIKEEIEVELWAIRFVDFPDGIMADQIGALAPIIVEE